jgi:hypothetical protein
MVDEIRKQLDKVTGELLESFIPFDKLKVLKFQAGLHAIHGAQKDIDIDKKTNLYAVCDDAALEKLLSEHGISKYDFDKVPSVIKAFENGELDAYEAIKQLPHLLQEAIQKVNEKSRNIYEVPASGMIAVTLNLINNDAKDALIAGQAGERTLQAIERISKNKSIAKKHNFRSSTKLSMAYMGGIGKEPRYLTAARATNHLADLLEGAVLLNPDIAENPSVKNSLEAFRYIIMQIFLQSSRKLKTSGVTEASEEFEKLAKYISKNDEKNNHEGAINAIRDGLDLAKNLFEGSDDESKHFENIINKRLDQLKDLEPV